MTDRQQAAPPKRPDADSHAGEPAGLTRRKWLIRGGSGLIIAFLMAGAVGGFEPFEGASEHWSAKVAFVAMLAALLSAGEWMIGRGYRHRG